MKNSWRGSWALRSAAIFLVVASVVGAVTLSLYAYEKLPSSTGRPQAEEPEALEVAVVRPRPQRRLQINQGIILAADRSRVVDLYARYTGSREVASVILDASLELDVPVNLAFAPCWINSVNLNY